ncbi:hypothetical protein [Shewanella aestuarii]|uniref:Uncharacterized protein n=1 Tax=Shewanella aestuarii TaxID=1028752 RepID=A0A6G9QJ22_9GAMM|nr:hypothetical protein [Shewanella aestuarii]QIR13881.1 hypothetical protein HBH39_04680 [Shewanella aestuarii]
MSNLNQFAQKLSADAALLEAYKKDPQGVMQANGLTAEEIKLVMAGDMAALKAHFGDDAYQSFVVVHHHSD